MDQPSDDTLLEPLPFKNQKADKAVKYYAERLFAIHGDKLPGSDAGTFLKEAVAYRGPLDGDETKEGAAVALDDVVSDSSRLTLRPRIPEKDAVLMVVYARAEGKTSVFHVLPKKLPVTEFGAFSCHDVVRHAAPGRVREDLDFYVLSGYSNEDMVAVEESELRADYNAGRLVRVDASTRVSEIVEPHRGRRRCHVLIFEKPCMRLQLLVTQPGEDDVGMWTALQPDHLDTECVHFVARFVAPQLEDNDHRVMSEAASRSLPTALLELEAGGHMKAYVELVTRRGARGPRSSQPLASPVILDSSHDLCGAMIYLRVEAEAGDVWLKLVGEKLLEMLQRPASNGRLFVQFADSLGPIERAPIIPLRADVMGVPFIGLAKYALEDLVKKGYTNAEDVRALHWPSRARLWTAPKNGPSLSEFSAAGEFDKDDPSLQDVVMSDSMDSVLKVSPTRGDLGPESVHCIEVILPYDVFSATTIGLKASNLSGDSSSGLILAVTTRAKATLNGSTLEIFQRWLGEFDDSAEHSTDDTVTLVRALLNPHLTQTYLEHLKIALLTDEREPVRIHDFEKPLMLAENGKPPEEVIFELCLDTAAVRQAEVSASFDVPIQGHATKQKKTKKKKKAKKKAKAKAGKEAESRATPEIDETSSHTAPPVAERDAVGGASSDSDSDSDATFTTAPAPELSTAAPSTAAADDFDDWVDVSASRRGRGAANRSDAPPPPPPPLPSPGAFAEESPRVVDPEEEWRASFERAEAERLQAEERRQYDESEALARRLEAEEVRRAEEARAQDALLEAEEEAKRDASASGAEEEKHADVDLNDARVVEILEGSGNVSLVPLFREHLIDDSVLPHLAVEDLTEIGLAPPTALHVFAAINASRMAASKLAVNEVMDDSARHQAALEAELKEHRAELKRLRLRREDVPDKLVCQITFELMKDPVMAADGHTFERVAIEQWFATGKRTSPATNEPLPDTRLIPNLAVKSMIAELLEKKSRALCDT
ncbi:hypothetical protein SO694_00009313 [Aureococcus anophagefferens]|uniref:U-box domain-containing protein n=2 Tax=Aureococcus anophagefferens TaxID=44056 RepID=A0ABR1GE66_AURAN